jgi:hypothetical protein
MYTKSHNLIVGFHGCDKQVRDAIVMGTPMKPSVNTYDWLGKGFYFWENGFSRAMIFAREKQARNLAMGKDTIKECAVLGAVLDLGFCLDFIDSAYLSQLAKAHTHLEHIYQRANIAMPQNISVNTSFDLLLRYLDRAVVETVISMQEEQGKEPFDSVRGVFWEGDEPYPNAGFREKNHIQVCIRNPNCIKGFFIPRETMAEYKIP